MCVSLYISGHPLVLKMPAPVSKRWNVVDYNCDMTFWETMKAKRVCTNINLTQTLTGAGTILSGSVVFKLPSRGWTRTMEDRPSVVLIHPQRFARTRHTKKGPVKFCPTRQSMTTLAPNTVVQAPPTLTWPTTQTPNTLVPEQTLLGGKFDVSALLLGQGSYGVVMAGFQRPDCQPVAINFFSADGDRHMTMLAALREWVKMQECQGHPNILKSKGFFMSAEPFLAAIVMDRADMSLRRFLESNYAACEACMQPNVIIKQMYAGLCYIHSKGVVHRDVKPGNILIAGLSTFEPPTVFMADFGLAASCRTASSDPRMAQTTYYRAPEVWLGGPCDTLGDMWSAVCVLCECVGWRVAESEQFHMSPVFKAADDIGVCNHICHLLGPSPPRWPVKCVRKPVTCFRAAKRWDLRLRNAQRMLFFFVPLPPIRV